MHYANDFENAEEAGNSSGCIGFQAKATQDYQTLAGLVNFLGSWNGKLVCDDFAGYKAGFERGMTEIGCMAHAHRKFFDLHVANKS